MTFDQDLPVASETPDDLIAIDDALRRSRRSTNERARSWSCGSSVA